MNDSRKKDLANCIANAIEQWSKVTESPVILEHKSPEPRPSTSNDSHLHLESDCNSDTSDSEDLFENLKLRMKEAKKCVQSKAKIGKHVRKAQKSKSFRHQINLIKRETLKTPNKSHIQKSFTIIVHEEEEDRDILQDIAGHFDLKDSDFNLFKGTRGRRLKKSDLSELRSPSRAQFYVYEECNSAAPSQTVSPQPQSMNPQSANQLLQRSATINLFNEEPIMEDSDEFHIEITECVTPLKINDYAGAEVLLDNQLKNLCSSEKFEDKIKVIVRTSQAYSNGFAKFKKLDLQHRAIEIKFVGDPAVDGGGVSRQFYTLVLSGIQEKLFRNGILVQAPDKICNQTYTTAGKIVASAAVLHKMRLQCMSAVQVVYVTHGLNGINNLSTLELVNSCDTETAVKLHKCLTEKTDVDGILLEMGIVCRNIEMGVHAAASHLLVFNHQAALDCFANGLQAYGFLKLLKENPVLACFLREADRIILTSEKFISMLDPRFSEHGSNRFQFEENTYYFFIDIIEDLEVKGRLEDLLEFTTGSRQVMVYQTPLLIRFIDAYLLPTASTCEQSLGLPLANSKEELLKKIEIALDNYYGFGMM